jgi:AraC-like DNA-binding protein
MIRCAQEQGLALERCIAGTRLQGDDLVDPTREIAGQQELAVLRNILRALDPRVPFGLLSGLRYRTTTHGAWGFAIIACPTFRDGIDVGTRYFDLTYSFNRLGFELTASHARLLYDDSDNPDDLRAALVERDMAALITLQRDILGQVIPIRRLQLRAPRPPYASAFEPLFGVAPQWSAEVNCIAVDACMLDVAGPFADPLGLRVAEQMCDAQLEQRRARSGIAGRVQARILGKPGELLDMDAVAAELGMSTRTLRNRLRRESTSYRKLVEEMRAALAEQLLATSMTLDEIAERLGYADTSSFIAAFKRWKGVAPGGYRDKLAE